MDEIITDPKEPTFASFAEDIFRRAPTDEAITYTQEEDYKGDQTETVEYTLASGIGVSIWRYLDETKRQETTVGPQTEFWVSSVEPRIRITLTNGAKIERYNFHIAVCADGEYLETPEVNAIDAPEFNTTFRGLAKTVAQLRAEGQTEAPDGARVTEEQDDIPEIQEPFRLGTIYWPMEQSSVNEILELIKPPNV